MPRINLQKILRSNLRTREKLSITQKEYASFCQVSVSHLNMIEQGKRSWPLKKNGGRMELELALDANERDPLPVPDLFEKEEWEKEEINKTKTIMNARLTMLQVELEKMEFNRQQAIGIYQVTSRLEKTFPADSTEELCILLWKRRSREKYKGNSKIQQRLLQLDIEAMQKKKAFLEDCLSENS